LIFKKPGVLGESALNAAANVLAKVEDLRVGNCVNDLQPLFPAGDDTGLREGLKMSRGVGLSKAGGVEQVGNAFFTGPEGLKQFEAARLAEDAKAGSDEVEGAIGEDGLLMHKNEILVAIALYAHIVM